MKTFLVPADGQWHTLPGNVAGVIASSRHIELDMFPHLENPKLTVARAKNTGPEPITIDYTNKEPVDETP